MLVYIYSDAMTSPNDFYTTESNRQWGDIYDTSDPFANCMPAKPSDPFADG